MIRRYTLVKTHMILASVIFPVTLMFFITGALYIADIKPGSSKEEFKITYNQPVPRDLGILKGLAERAMASRDIAKPLGKAKMKSGYLDWNGRNLRIKFGPSAEDAKVAVLKVYTPSWYNQFMRLHKGKGKDAFDIFVIVSAIIMMLIILSGTVTGLSLPKLRSTVYYSMGAGTLIFVGLMIYSQFI